MKDKLPKHKLLVFTGPIDAYYASLGMPKLEYRSLRFEKEYHEPEGGYYQEALQVRKPASKPQRRWRAGERGHPTGHPTLQTLRDPILLFCRGSRGGCVSWLGVSCPHALPCYQLTGGTQLHSPRVDYSDEEVTNRDTKVRHGATENGP
jgi:hypothetical protein